MRPIILVVDDEPLSLHLVARVLRDEPVQVLCAGDPAEALALLESRTPDLLILDMKLPAVHGLDLVHLLRGGRMTPAIAMTGGDVDEDEVRAQGFGALLRKPFSPADLRRAVRDLLPP